MDEQTCKKAIYSNDWYDLMLRKEDVAPQPESVDCMINLDGAYQMWYFERGFLPEINYTRYTYSAVPKCFTPLSEQALDASGILRIREQPNLALTGEH